MDPVHHKFKHLLFTTRVPLDEKLTVHFQEWKKKESIVKYGVVLIDEFRSEPDIKIFHFQNKKGDRIRFFPTRLEWKPHLRYMAIGFLKKNTNLNFEVDRPWNQVVDFPLKKHEPDSFQFKIISLNYQRLAAHCNENIPLLNKIQKQLEDIEIEYSQEWLRMNYIPSKLSLKPIIDHEFIRFVTCFDKKQLEEWLHDKTKCLNWKGTYDFKTNSAQFKRSTKISGRNVRRCVTVKEIMYQFFIGNFGGYQSLYLDFDKCTHRSKCVNPHHYIKARRQSFNNCAKRRRLIDEHNET